MPIDHLVIGDAHATPEADNERFDILGEYAVKHLPAVLVCMGDAADMASLSSYDRGRLSFEGRRYEADIRVTRDAFERINKPIEAYNRQRQRLKEKQYKPRKVLLLGNHEHRINRYVQDNPEMDGKMSVRDLGYEEYGWEVYDYQQTVVIDGIAYSHNFPIPNSRRELSGLHVARKSLQQNFMSSTSAHSHLLDHHNIVRIDGKRQWGLVAGCYFEHTPEYVKHNVGSWWRGLVHKKNVRDGDYDMDLVSLDTLRKGAA